VARLRRGTVAGRGFAKFAIVSVLGTAVAFAVAHLADKVPRIRAVLALQLLLWEMSESMGNHDSEVVDASSVD